MCLEDCCIQTKEPKTLKFGTQLSTTLPIWRCSEILEIPCGMGEIPQAMVARGLLHGLSYKYISVIVIVINR